MSRSRQTLVTGSLFFVYFWRKCVQKYGDNFFNIVELTIILPPIASIIVLNFLVVYNANIFLQYTVLTNIGIYVSLKVNI